MCIRDSQRGVALMRGRIDLRTSRQQQLDHFCGTVTGGYLQWRRAVPRGCFRVCTSREQELYYIGMTFFLGSPVQRC